MEDEGAKGDGADEADRPLDRLNVSDLPMGVSSELEREREEHHSARQPELMISEKLPPNPIFFCAFARVYFCLKAPLENAESKHRLAA